MSLVQRRRAADGPIKLSKHTVGNALVVHPASGMTRASQELALRVAPDGEHDLVVVDLPPGLPISMWESVAALLPRHRQGVRLVINGRSRETTALAGQWLSERLGRPVVAPDGRLRRGVGGTLFVESGQGSGWVRFRPGRPPSWETKRFPRPPWDIGIISEVTPTSARCVAEPIPGGIWIRPVGYDAQQRQSRVWLTEALPCQPEVLTIVLGAPGCPPVSLDDAARVWKRLPEEIRGKVRFAHYGPVWLAEGRVFSQELADLLSTRITSYTGLPMGPGQPPAVHSVGADGRLGWQAFARELAYEPGASSGTTKAPTLISHRPPLQGIEEVSPAVYWYAPDAVIEVVQSGLWLRPPEDLAHADVVRSVPLDWTMNRVVFEVSDAARAARMRMLAEDVMARLDPPTRQISQFVSAASLLSGRPVINVGGRALGSVDSEAGSPRRAALENEAATSVQVGPGPMVINAAAPDLSATATGAGQDEIAILVNADTVSLEAEPAPTKVLRRPATQGGQSPAEAKAAVAAPPAPPTGTAPPTVDSTGPATPATQRPTEPAAPLGGFRLESQSIPGQEESFEIPEPPPPAAPPEPAAPPAPPEDAEQQAPAPTAPAELPVERKLVVRVQPTPAGDASALIPTSGMEEERRWLRSNLGQQYGTLANAVARVLSEHPGFHGALTRSAGEVLTDAVAVRLYLSGQGASVDEALRTATVGPHIPFARCVVAGLARLPSHRGPSVFAASPTEEALRLYREHQVITEWGFTHALSAPCSETKGEYDVLLWAMTARRTKLLEPETDGIADRVLFVPGTSFKVLDIVEPKDGARGQLMLRELAAGEIDSDGRVDPSRVSLDELATNTLLRQVERWAAEKPQRRIDVLGVQRFDALPGLVSVDASTERGDS
ncbi:MAG TPA: hypothetical protein VHX38_25375 [Pseudonocardiaceae bacterium]|jgi:hypothetical protein|nr:hypothetical protein [Pseudonocardiaceae bacterium]